jgi:hypothetical protein
MACHASVTDFGFRNFDFRFCKDVNQIATFSRAVGAPLVGALNTRRWQPKSGASQSGTVCNQRGHPQGAPLRAMSLS